MILSDGFLVQELTIINTTREKIKGNPMVCMPKGLTHTLLKRI
ncbi:hypothetical protein SAMN05446037_102147 [Anaerovirgula multivorans]|uniref:Uncharacterized protein n=1 Tax=Anaerovirgula multivorans TaxID=312168 RepID=A0A239HDP5_9FIRM|nr:hypothetical protein [Anaerovirgula multivorans]SNS79480.1 hypothetical protein SAMN05446037_102147 [Anaerovirgula multivorans]